MQELPGLPRAAADPSAPVARMNSHSISESAMNEPAVDKKPDPSEAWAGQTSLGASSKGLADHKLLIDRAERVEAKENSVRKALALLRGIRAKVEKADLVLGELELSALGSVLDQIIREHSSFEFFVGAAGDTGMGKTSLLNALISPTADIAPSSQSSACTAAVCCFHHSPAEAGRLYSARIQLKAKVTVDQELEAFFQEYTDLNDRAADGEEDVELQGERDKLEHQLDVIHRWSGVEKQTLRSLGENGLAGRITSECRRGDELFNYGMPDEGVFHDFHAATAREFLQKLKPYVGSSGKKTQPQIWPLVEVAHVHVDAPILRNGIVLVDLPGETDALESRSQVARTYYNKLDRLIVVAPCDRAKDNRTALDLIREDQIIDMEADGKIDAGGLCVVTAKTDQLQWKALVEDEWEPQDISPDFPRLLEKYESTKEALEQLEEEEEGDSDWGENDGASRKPSNRQRKLNMKLAELDAACFRACIKARSRHSKEMFQEHFDRIRNSIRKKSTQRAATNLELFAVSSKAHRNLAKGSPDDAFPDAATTGFKELEAWIVNASLGKREEHADSILHQCQVLFDATDGWAGGQHVILKLPREELARIHAVLDHMKSVFHEDMKKSRLNLLSCLGKKHILEMSNKDNELARGMTRDFPDHVDQFQRGRKGAKLHWATYAACIRRRGGLHRAKARTGEMHCWQDRTYGFYWAPHVLKWNEALNRWLPDYYSTRLRPRDKAKARTYADLLETYEGLPVEWRAAFRKRRYKVDNLVEMFLVKVGGAVSAYRHKLRDIKQAKTRELISEAMAEGYVAAGQVKGRRKHVRQVKTMADHAEVAQYSIFFGIGELLGQQFRVARKEMGRVHSTLITECVRHIGKELDALAREICSEGGPKNKKLKPDPAIQELKDDVASDAWGWRKYWGSVKERLPEAEERGVYEDEEDQMDRAKLPKDYLAGIPLKGTGEVDFDALIAQNEEKKRPRKNTKKNKSDQGTKGATPQDVQPCQEETASALGDVDDRPVHRLPPALSG